MVPAPGCGFDRERTAQMMDALLHADQAEAAHAAGVEAAAVVLHGENNFGALLLHHDLDGARLRMARAIVQRFLHHAINTGPEIVGQFVGGVVVASST